MQIEILAQQHDLGGSLPGQHGNHQPSDALTPSSGGGRAAELARRMHGISGRQASVAPSISASSVMIAPESVESPTAIAVQEAPATETAHSIEAQIQTMAEPIKKVSSPPVVPIETVDFEPHHAADLTHLYGVRQTSRGMLFIQSATLGKRVSIVGDFNFWNAEANLLRFDEAHGVLQAIIELPPGTHQYSLIADGQWLLDPHNPNTAVNSYGEPNSVVVAQPLS